MVLETRPRDSEAVKPSELIQISSHQSLSFNARRAITILWHNAHMHGIAEGKDELPSISTGQLSLNLEA